jgi:hypothetical protein
MCVEELRALACGLPWSDHPGSESQTPTHRVCIGINDAGWSSNEARTKGCLPLVLLAEEDAPPGWLAAYLEAFIRQTLSGVFRQVAGVHLDEEHRAALRAAADRCEIEGTPAAARAADAATGAARAADTAAMAAYAIASRAARAADTAARAADAATGATAAARAAYAATGAAYAAAKATAAYAAARAAYAATPGAAYAAAARAADAATGATAAARAAYAATGAAADEVLAQCAALVLTAHGRSLEESV